MITERQLIEEYALACHTVAEAAKKNFDTIEADYRVNLQTALVKRDTLADLLKRYFNTSEKVLQHILDEANNANYHL